MQMMLLFSPSDQRSALANNVATLCSHRQREARFSSVLIVSQH